MKYLVTITPKYPGWNSKPWTVEVEGAKSKRDASKIARSQLERDGHIFTRDDAATFKAEKINTPKVVLFSCCNAWGNPNPNHVCDPPRDGGNE